MKTFSVAGQLGVSTVLAGAEPGDIQAYCPAAVGAVVTDANVARLYGELFPSAPVITLSPGEGSKTLIRAGEVLEKLSDLEIDRTGFLLGIGGGVVCDLAGFCAATYMRGISFGFVPTTLLAQVDAAIGGKNGVNLGRYKNLVGTFSQPEFVLCCPVFLDTLEPDTLRDGLAECIKAGAIADGELFELIANHPRALLERDPAILREVIERSIAVKVAVVSADEREAGCRRLLNFGHTFGHAVERLQGLSHGASVSIGMVVAVRLSVNRGLFSPGEGERLVGILEAVGLPTSLAGDPELVVEALRRDKKRQGRGIEFVLLSGLGRAVTEKISLEELGEVARDLC